MIGLTVLQMGKHLGWSLLLLGVLGSICQSAWADYWLQVASYSKSLYAHKMAQSLVAEGFSVGLRNVSGANGRPLIQFLVGPYSNRSAAKTDLARLHSQGLAQDGFIRQYNRGTTIDERLSPVQEKADVELPSSQALSGMQGSPPSPPVAAASNNSEQTELDTPVVEEAPLAATPPPPPPVSGEPNVLSLDAISSKPPSHVTGFFQSELAYTEAAPEHLSKFRNTLEVGAEGHFTPDTAWKVSGRVAYDAVFDLTDYYSTAVRDNQQLEKSVRETYMDISAGDWDFRLGRQQIIWGEMVGLFLADVVSAKDLREFVLPEFDMLRIPQWAIRSEYFKGDFHGEVIWIPYPTYDNIGVPGAEFYPYPTPPPPGYGMVIAPEQQPTGGLADSNYGLRLSDLVNGWDLSVLYYNSMDLSPTFFREVVTTPTPLFVYSPDHKRIQQLGATLSKAYTDTVWRLETVYTHDRRFPVDNLSDIDGVVQKDSLDYALGWDYNLPRDSRLNLQFFQRWFPHYDSTMTAKRLESGASVFVSTKFMDGKLEPQLLVMTSLSRGDWMTRPKLVWTLSGNWRWVLGADLFNGPHTSLFGQYDSKDRVYTEIRYIF